MKYICTVYTTDGREFASSIQEDNEDTIKSIIDLITDLKNLKHFAIPVNDALGRDAKVYFHPNHVVAVGITKVSF